MKYYIISIILMSFVTHGSYNPGELPEVLRAVYKSYDEYWIYIDFDRGMQVEQFPQALQVTQQVVGIDGYEFFNFCRDLYNAHNLSQISLDAEPRIPKIIHQIWLGGSVPVVFKNYMNSWIKNHMGRDWRYKLWTDRDVDNFNLYNQVFYDQSDNYGVKSDILRWEIIYRYGGVYVDMDFECFKPLDILHHAYDFYTALQPLDTLYLQLGAALFAAKPGDPILKHCIETIKDDWHKKHIPERTGPVHFTRSFFAVAGKDGSRVIVFPAHYFYPLGCREHIVDIEDWNRKHNQWTVQGAWGVHWWSKTWLPANHRPPQFRQLYDK